MIYQMREVNYSDNYKEFFQGLTDMKKYIENKYPDVVMTPMYNLDGVRGKVHILTSYPDLGKFQTINDELDKDDKFMDLVMKVFAGSGKDSPVVDHFFRGLF